MIINFILNGEDVTIDCDDNIRLIDIIRQQFNLMGAKAGCCSGKCGFCSVLFNGSVCNACLIPAFRLPSSEVITIEGFSQTAEYQDVVNGFSKANLENCGFCSSSKILCAAALLDRVKKPERQQIFHAFNVVKCRCTDPEALVRGVMAITAHRKRRHFARSS